MARATYEIAVDWDNDGNFTGPEDDISSDVYEMQWEYGRDQASQLVGRTLSARFSATLRNSSGKYNSFYTSSPIYGSIVPGRPVRVRMTSGSTVIMFYGFLDSMEPRPERGGRHTATLRAIGPLAYISQRGLYDLAVQTALTTGAAVSAILDASGWSATLRDIDTGQTTMVRFFLENRGTYGVRNSTNGWGALKLIEDTEGGFLREGKDGKIIYEDRYRRLTAALSTTSQGTFSDTGTNIGVYEIEQEDPLKQIFNIIVVPVQLQTVGGETTLWTNPEAVTTGGAPSIPAGENKTFVANCPNEDSANNIAAVNSWTTPVATTDYLANSQADGLGTDLTASISIQVWKAASQMGITLINNHATLTAYIIAMQARGLPLVNSNKIEIIEEDAASQAKYGERVYPVPGNFISDSNSAREYARFIKSIYKDPIPIMRITFLANNSSDHLSQAMNRDVSDRVTLNFTNTDAFGSKLGISQDFFIESIQHIVRAGGTEHWVKWELSPVSGYAGFWVLGVSTLGISTKLAY